MPATLEKPESAAKPAKDWSRLYRAIESARSGMKVYRQNKRAIVEQIVGSQYSDNGAKEPVPVNEMRFAFYVYQQMLTPKHPQGLFVTRAEPLKRAVEELQETTNQTLDGMELADTLEEALGDALVSMGITKTVTTYEEHYSVPSYHGSGYPCCRTVSLDNFIWDFRAEGRDDIEFLGDQYRMRREDAEDNDAFDQDVVAKIPASERRTHNDTGEEKTGTISRGDDAADKDDEVYDYIDLIDVYLPRRKLFLTISADMATYLPPLRETKWEGPGCYGPYDLLMFKKVPGQLMGLPPAVNWQDLHGHVNELMRKLLDQGLRQKKVGLANARVADDVKSIKDALDGEIIVSTGTPAVVEMSFGGVDNNTLAFSTALMGLFNKLNGNIEVLAGLGPQSNTLGQDEMINAAANKSLVDMQERVFRFVAGIIRKVAWIIQSDPMVDIKATKPLRIRPDIRVPFKYNAQTQPAELTDYNVQIHPYSMTSQAPAARLNAINGFMQSVGIPMYQAMAQQGIVIDWPKFVDLWSQYAQLPEIKDLLKVAPQGPMPPDDETIKKPPTSNRTYTRRNVSDTSPDADRQKLISSLMSTGGQNQAA